MTIQPQTVLITGASSGIGLELAKLFARDNYNMVLVARCEKMLNETAFLLQDIGAGNITVLPKDLSIANAASEIYTTTKQRGIQIDILVNDAGIGEYGSFADTCLETELSMIQLNIASLVQLTKLYVRDMLLEGGGRILQLASVASYQPTPLLAVYAATKAFVLSFSDAIGTELRDTDVTVTALIPNSTNTDFFHKAGMEHTKAAQKSQDPAAVAKIGYSALMRGESHAYAPGTRHVAAMSSLTSNRNMAIMAEKQMQPADN